MNRIDIFLERLHVSLLRPGGRWFLFRHPIKVLRFNWQQAGKGSWPVLCRNCGHSEVNHDNGRGRCLLVCCSCAVLVAR